MRIVAFVLLTKSRRTARRLKERGKAKIKSNSDHATVTANSFANVHVTRYESQFIRIKQFDKIFYFFIYRFFYNFHFFTYLSTYSHYTFL